MLTLYIYIKHEAAIVMRIHEKVNAMYIHVRLLLLHLG